MSSSPSVREDKPCRRKWLPSGQGHEHVAQVSRKIHHVECLMHEKSVGTQTSSSWCGVEDAKHCPDLNLPRVSEVEIDTQGIFYMPHNHVTCVSTIFGFRKSIDSSRDQVSEYQLHPIQLQGLLETDLVLLNSG
ncbi:hypothetical protein TNCV_3610991 [Trichonephila clavipes]|nr:hypothetical protein TNCV_3610991 [Trichonephila clavipes]